MYTINCKKIMYSVMYKFIFFRIDEYFEYNKLIFIKKYKQSYTISHYKENTMTKRSQYSCTYQHCYVMCVFRVQFSCQLRNPFLS